MAETTPVIAIVGADSLLGRELSEVLETRKLPARIKLVSAEPEEANAAFLAERGGEAVFMTSLAAGELSGSRIVLLAGTPESSLKVVETVRNEASAPNLIDLTGALEDNPAARLRAPIVEDAPPPASPIQVIAHPAAIALALFLKQLARAATIQRIVAQVFEPVSERGKRGLDELQRQTVNLFSFQKLQKEVFDAQVSFNMLPQYGAEAVKSLEDVEGAVERHLATLLSGNANVPFPSLRVVHAPVFHGYSISLWVEFETRPGIDALNAALATPLIEVRAKDEEAPSNVGATGFSGITVGSIVADRNSPRACWFWLVADNLRLAADNAVEVARELLA